jgi:hypothetical protein
MTTEASQQQLTEEGLKEMKQGIEKLLVKEAKATQGQQCGICEHLRQGQTAEIQEGKPMSTSAMQAQSSEIERPAKESKGGQQGESEQQQGEGKEGGQGKGRELKQGEGIQGRQVQQGEQEMREGQEKEVLMQQKAKEQQGTFFI